MSVNAADDWAAKHGKTIITLLLAGCTAWFGLEAQVKDKVSRAELITLVQRIETLQGTANDLTRRMDDLMGVMCQTRRAELGCQQYLHTTRSTR